MTPSSENAGRQTGISYVEVLVAAALITATVLPAADSLYGAIDGSNADVEATAHHYRVRGRLEELLTESFNSLAGQAAGPAVASSYSDTAGTPARRIVYISAYDGDNADADNDPFTGTDPDLLWIQVEIEGTVNALQVLRTK